MGPLQIILTALGTSAVTLLITFLVGQSGVLGFLRDTFLSLRHASHQEDSAARAASALAVSEAVKVIEAQGQSIQALSGQVRDLRAENLGLVDQLNHEISALRTELRTVKARVAELEADLEAERGENIKLKAQLYDQHIGKRGTVTRMRPRRPSASPPDEGA